MLTKCFFGQNFSLGLPNHLQLYAYLHRYVSSIPEDQRVLSHLTFFFFFSSRISSTYPLRSVFAAAALGYTSCLLSDVLHWPRLVRVRVTPTARSQWSLGGILQSCLQPCCRSAHTPTPLHLLVPPPADQKSLQDQKPHLYPVNAPSQGSRRVHRCCRRLGLPNVLLHHSTSTGLMDFNFNN